MKSLKIGSEHSQYWFDLNDDIVVGQHDTFLTPPADIFNPGPGFWDRGLLGHTVNAAAGAPLAVFDVGAVDPSFLPDADAPDRLGTQGLLHTGTTLGTGPVNSTTPINGVTGHWDGITFQQGGLWYPPDNALAVGGSVVLSAVNDALQATALDGTSAQTINIDTLLSSREHSGYFRTDEKLQYDATNHRFVLTCDEVSNSSFGRSSYTILAVSDSDFSSTTDAVSASHWHIESIATNFKLGSGLRATTTFADQPLTATDGHYIYQSTNQFGSITGSFSGSVIGVYTDGLYNSGGTSTLVSKLALSAPSYCPVGIEGGQGAFFVSDTHNALSILKATPTSTSVTFSTPVTVSLGSIDFGSGHYAAAQPGTTNQLDAGDGRVTSVAYDAAHQKLYAVFEIQPSSGSTVPGAELVQLDMSRYISSGYTTAPTLLHSYNLNSLLPSSMAGAATFNSSVAVNANGDVLVNFNVSGPSAYVSDDYAVWTNAGAATTSSAVAFSAMVDYHDSAAIPYVDPAHVGASAGVNRWGDYSSAVGVGSGFYISNEFCNGTYTSSGSTVYPSWGTAVAHVDPSGMVV
jgi:hypothetical protein